MTGLAVMITAGTIALLLQGQVSRPAAGDDPVIAACREAGGSHDSCACVSRELRSRFNPAQITVIVEAMPEIDRVGEPQALVDELGFTLDQILNLRQRAIRADTVIRSACGHGLSREG